MDGDSSKTDWANQISKYKFLNKSIRRGAGRQRTGPNGRGKMELEEKVNKKSETSHRNLGNNKFCRTVGIIGSAGTWKQSKKEKGGEIERSGQK